MRTWMLVEDEADIYDVLLTMFEIWGVDGTAFVDGPETLDWIDAVDEGRVRGDLPELAMLDIRLPQSSGLEIGRRIRESPVLGNIVIILITAYRLSPEEEREATAIAGADTLMYKPLPAMPELFDCFEELIARRKLSTPLFTNGKSTPKVAEKPATLPEAQVPVPAVEKPQTADYVNAAIFAFGATLMVGLPLLILLDYTWFLMFFIAPALGGLIGEVIVRNASNRPVGQLSPVVGGAIFVGVLALMVVNLLWAILFGVFSTGGAMARLHAT